MSRAAAREYGVLFAWRCLRVLAQMLPVKVIWAVGWPAAAIQAAWQLAFAGPTLREFDRLPAALRPSLSRLSFALYLSRERTHVNLAKLMCLWPDRLCSAALGRPLPPRWLRNAGTGSCSKPPRCACALHFGLQPLLVHWLRALGMPAAGLRERPSAERPLYLRYIDRLTARPDAGDLPIVFDLSELRGMLAHLRRTNCRRGRGRWTCPAYSPGWRWLYLPHGHRTAPDRRCERSPCHPLPDCGRAAHELQRALRRAGAARARGRS